MRYVLPVLALLCPVAAGAAPLDGNTARKQLFATKGGTVQVKEDTGFSATEMLIIQSFSQAFQSQGLANYYGAIAVSPGFFKRIEQGPEAAAESGLFAVVERLHSPAAAAAAALAQCDEARKRSDAKCTVVAHILPKKYRTRDLTLSVTATQAMADYRKAKTPKAMAVSEGSSAFAVISGTGAQDLALETCNEKAGGGRAADCRIVIADD